MSIPTQPLDSTTSGPAPVPPAWSGSPRSVPPSGPRSLDDLAAMKPAALAGLYRAALTPGVSELNGDLVGRMLAVPVLPGWMFGPLRRFAAWTLFPWRGKSFTSRDHSRGGGINPVVGVPDPRRWFRYETRVAPSRAGAFDALHLDYDHADNPALIRAIEDELRQVAPGLYLGLAYLRWRKRPRLILYFGLARS